MNRPLKILLKQKLKLRAALLPTTVSPIEPKLGECVLEISSDKSAKF